MCWCVATRGSRPRWRNSASSAHDVGKRQIRCIWMRTTCGGQTRRFSGKIRPAMSHEIGSGENRIREFRSDDVAQVLVILREAPEAAQWAEPELRSMGWLTGLRAFVSESGAGITGVVIGRQAAGEAEILNLAVR